MRSINLAKKQIFFCLLGVLALFSFSGCGVFDPLAESGLGLKLYFVSDGFKINVYDIYRNEAKVIYDDPYVFTGTYSLMTVDSINKKLYFYDNDNNIFRCNLDGTDKELFLNITASALAFNPNKESLFAATATGINEVNIETKQMHLINNIASVNCLALDDVRSVLYFSSGSDIYKLPANIIYSTAGNIISSLTIDTAENKLYWAETSGGAPPYSSPIYFAPADNCTAKTELFYVNFFSSLVIDPRSPDFYWTQQDMMECRLFVKKNNEPPEILHQFTDVGMALLAIDLWP